jgi:hypothetical protein
MIHRLRSHIRRRPGQSLVEFTVLLPILLIMISGLIEFGFMLNFYLDLIDAARETARQAADDDALHTATGTWTDYNVDFYTRAWDNLDRSLDWGGQITLDDTADEVVISVFSVAGTTVRRFPYASGGNGGENGWMRWMHHPSDFSTADIQGMLDGFAPNTGVVLVEVYYDYHMVMALPWITAFVPNPMTLHAYTIMPNSSAEPTPTP